MKELYKISKMGKAKILDKLVTHAETLSKGKAVSVGYTQQQILTSQLTAVCFLDTVRVVINELK